MRHPIQTLLAVLTAVAIAAAVSAPLVLPPAPAATSASDSPIFPGGLYLEANTDAAKAADRLRSEGLDEQAALIDQIASQPTAVWLGDWFSDDLLKRVIARHVEAAQKQGTTLVFVTYSIPNRDCGGYSAGGYDYEDYLAWNRTIAAELEGTGAVVLVEPDSLSMLSSAKCAKEVLLRPPLIREAVDILSSAGLRIYLDGGNSNWLKPDVQASWLKQAGIANADGFFTNVSNFQPTQAERDYAGKVSARVGWKHYVIDVSRNGNGWTGTWCNPSGAALGPDPQATDGKAKLDALLWVKHPGASDGTCNGGPPAGDWFESYALDLVRNR